MGDQNELAKALETVTSNLIQASESTLKLIECSLTLTNLVQKLTDLNLQAAADIVAREDDMRKSVAESRALMMKISEAHHELTKKIGITVGKSNEDIARQVAAAKNMNNRQAAETDKAAGYDGFYSDVASRF